MFVCNKLRRYGDFVLIANKRLFYLVFKPQACNFAQKLRIVGRTKFSQREIDIIAKLLGRKMAGNRSQQKMVRHTLRTVFEFNISDFNVQGKAFGPADLHDAVRRGAIRVLDEATVESMRLRHAEKKRHEETLAQAEAIADGEAVDWQAVQREWEEYYAQHPEEAGPAVD